jgi:hypothetical protein
MTTARSAMHYLVMTAFICATSQSALAQQTKVTTAKVTPVVAVKPAPAPASKPGSKPPVVVVVKPPVVVVVKPPVKPPVVKQTCLDIYNQVPVKMATLNSQAKVVNVSATPVPTLSSSDLKNSNIQAALRATLLKVALVALSKIPPGKACDALIAKIDAKFSRT